MIESLMLCGIGLLAGCLLMLLFFPAVHQRAVRLTRRDLIDATPLTAKEIQARKGSVAGAVRVSVRRLELNMEQMRVKATERAADRQNAELLACGLRPWMITNKTNELAFPIFPQIGNGKPMGRMQKRGEISARRTGQTADFARYLWRSVAYHCRCRAGVVIVGVTRGLALSGPRVPRQGGNRLFSRGIDADLGILGIISSKSARP
jgi:hypothetical protein